jgi:hypothetical protein
MTVPVAYPGSSDLTPFVHWRHAVPYLNEGRRISPVKLKVQYGVAKRAGVVHRLEAVASVVRNSQFFYGARWLCGSGTRDAVLVANLPDPEELCAVCKEHGPAVYRFFDATGQVLYIGSTISIARRRKQHTTAPWWPAVAAERVDQYPTRAEAATAEVRAIKAELPLHNRTYVR